MKVKIYNRQGKTSSQMDLPGEIFNVTGSNVLLGQVVRVYLANRRKVIASTKDRSQVAGGGRKPYRQKGTGSARAGSIRSPLWRKGGITFGPNKERNYTLKMNKKMSKKAIKMALSEKINSKKLIIVSQLNFDKIKTAQVVDLLEKLPIQEGKILIVLAKTNANLELSAANLPYLKIIQLSGLNLIDLLKYDYVITDKEGAKGLIQVLSSKETQ